MSILLLDEMLEISQTLSCAGAPSQNAGGSYVSFLAIWKQTSESFRLVIALKQSPSLGREPNLING